MAGTKNKNSVDRFPEVMRLLRKEKGITQEELAHRAGLHFNYISQIERGLKSPSLRSLAQIADVLDIPLSTFSVDVKLGKYKGTRYWAVWVNGELLAVTVYKKGAAAIKEILFPGIPSTKA